MALVIRIESIRDFKGKDNIENACKYYISSINASAKEFQHTIRKHWAIENKLH
ncbi:MAG: hypothetical protein LC664_06945 [Flavobacteriales bacterium]|nr:hypothetical protein [Flavobacteriales bacterium]